MNTETGKFIIAIGALLLFLGLIIYFFHDKLHWVGHLPGDIRIERENFKFYFPITTMVLASIVVSVIVWIVRKLH